MIDISEALAIIDRSVAHRGAAFRPTRRRSLIVARLNGYRFVAGRGRAPSDNLVWTGPSITADVRVDPLATMPRTWRPQRQTIGATAVLRAAERVENAGGTWGQSRLAARDAAARVVDLIPDRMWIAAADGQAARPV